MTAWTKANYDEAWEFFPESRLDGHPNTRPQVSLHYHESAMKPIIDERWRRILKVLTPTIGASDRVLVVGAGFGWGVRALKGRSECAAIGTDTSAYIQAEKDNDDSLEIEAEIRAVGLDPATGRGLEVLTATSTPGARAKELVLDEDLASVGSRQRVDEALGGEPTWIVTEDLVEDAMTDAQIIELAGHFDQWAAKKLWLYTPTPARSAEDLATLTGHEVLRYDTLGAAAGPDLKEPVHKLILDEDHGVVG